MAASKRKTKAKEEPKDKGGRPDKLTPDVHERIVALTRAGNFMETAAAAAGIDRETLRQWLKKGARVLEDSDDPKELKFKAFADAVTEAAGASEATLLTLISNSARGGTWQAAAWILERKFPDRYGRRQKIDARVSGQVSVGLAAEFEHRSIEDLKYYSAHGHFPEEAPEDK